MAEAELEGEQAMETATGRREEYNTNLPVLHLAFELSNKNWKLGFTVGLGQTPRERSVSARDMMGVFAEIAAAKRRFKPCKAGHTRRSSYQMTRL